MTKEEKKVIVDYLKALYKRINDAKEAIRNQNYGIALDILSDAYPELKIEVDGTR